MYEFKIRKKYFILLILFICISIFTEIISQYFFKGTFRNYWIIPSIIICLVTIRSILKKNFNDKFIKFCSVLLLLMIILTPIAMPKYSYKEAGNIVFKDIKVEDNTAEFSGDIKRKTMLSKLVPSVFVREFYTIRINTREEDRYFYFNPVSGEYFEGRPPK